MTISNVEPEIIRPFLKFVYTGEISLEVKNVIPILDAAKFFQIPELVVICEEKLKSALTEQTALLLLEQAILYDKKKLEEAAKKIVCRFAYNIFETEEFLEVRKECLLKLLGEDNLTVKNELQVFDALIRWAKAECKRQGVIYSDVKVLSTQIDEAEFALKADHGENQVLTQEELLSVYFYQKIPVERRSEVPTGLFNPKPRRHIDDIIRVNLLSGDCMTFDVKPSDTILSIKEKVEDKVGRLPYAKVLTFRGQILNCGWANTCGLHHSEGFNSSLQL